MLSTIKELQNRLNLFQHEISEAVNPSAHSRRRPKKHAQIAAAPTPHLSGAKRKQPRHVILFEALIAQLPCAWDLINKNEPTKLYAKQQRRRSDRRLDDILRVVDNKTNATPVDKLFGSAAQRSLAMQYSNFQREKGTKARVDELCDALSNQKAGQKCKLRNGRRGTIKSWVEENLDYEKEKTKVVTQFLQSGIKQLVLEKLLQMRLSSSAETQTTKASGISALTALTITPFKNLGLDEIPSLLDSILAADVNLPVPAPERPSMGLLDTINVLSEWLGEFLGTYDSRYSTPTRRFL